ncbi:uncharacterized protein ASPGLDRAFT_129601 [Aspergillus glaucus CBS 516.65]|uniref:Uncharacterized protein n=1 Tax=Aspergillus glaucus CBS 516.65 TaxID=1160497 RepID=A0A1L9VF78_ASPGL|nr:hypothetical protein ASPGLDRAFT_129601 [Aspergillus glaucus CBS 516.65]OJJ82598.1 hypothetical protein ASPGLDRAFT_129601 [Aspergillus glaucus CBS 516.65]
MQSISGLLTVIITTSPTPSSPSTDLISSVIESFRLRCPDLAATRVIVVFDTFDRIAAQNRLKSGSASPEVARNYSAYKDNVKSLVLREYVNDNDGHNLQQATATAEFGSPNDENNSVELAITHTRDKHVTFIEPLARLGFGLAVRSALRVVETPYVWVQQHDWALVANIPLQPLLEVMRSSSSTTENIPKPIKYISFPSIRMHRYAVSDCVNSYPTLRTLTATLKEDFSSSLQPDVQVPLTPLFFWFDKPHLASTEHYLSRVFPTRLAMRRGEFIEDKIGQRARGQMKDGEWGKWATWLYYPDDGRELCLRHLMGRTWRGGEGGLVGRYQKGT